jgi:putative (di)nucleoside polyphosphate hydrolase
VTQDLPYRRSAGVMLINRDGAAFIGRRKRSRDGLVAGHEWQMPQGGVDEGEAPYDAARRELFEETNVSSVSLIAEAPKWLRYDLPKGAKARWSDRYRGQMQKWFLLRFEGEEAEIDIDRPAAGAHAPEFDAWRWESLERLPSLVVPFKRRVYEQVVAVFAPLALPLRR